MVRTRGFVDDARHGLCADPSDNRCKSLAVICNLQRLTVNKTVQIDMVFRDVRADGNIRHLFSSPMLVIRAQSSGIRSGRFEKMGAITL